MIKTFDEAVNYMNDIPRFTEKHENSVTVGFLAEFGDPDLLPGMKIIHVAGTNGKGSVCCYLTSMLREMGYRVGTFTSPHLLDVRERMMLDGVMISREKFLEYTNRILALVEQDPERFPHPSYFEFLLLIGLQWYQEEQPDYLILEVGLGGRLDATNAIRNKAVSVITRIGLDHMEYLGNTIGEIAAEKAGIILDGRPVVCLSEPAEACERIRKIADRCKAPLSVVEKHPAELSADGRGIDFSYGCRYDVYGSLCINARLLSPAEYQAENAALSVRALEICGLEDEHLRSRMTGETLKSGLERALWPGRMEEVLPGFYLDGAHNEDGIRAFLETVKDLVGTGPKGVLLFSAVKDKEYERELKSLAASGCFGVIVVSPMRGYRALDGRTLYEAALQALEETPTDTKVVYEETLEEALKQTRQLQEERGCIGFAAGSLYLVGELKEILGNDQL